MKPNNKILFFAYGPHYFHKAIADYLKCEYSDILDYKKSNSYKVIAYFINSILGNYQKYSTFLCEGTFLIPSLFKYLPIKRFKKNIINISADPSFYYYIIRRTNFLKRILFKKALRKVDLFICVGEMVSKFLRQIFPNAKYIIIYPYIEEERYKKLLYITPKNLSNHNILFISNGPDWYYKGLDLIIDSFKEIRKEFHDSKLFILGHWDDKIKEKFKSDGVFFLGYKKVEEFIPECSLYLHTGRGEVFSVSTLEALLGGLPAIVSEFTGVKEIIKELNENFVVPLDREKIAKKVIEYFNLSLEEKIRLSNRAKELGARFTKDNLRILSVLL
ncbi:MAG: glycosyltransferase family 4 protein [Dictyoglomus sp.]|nr:glycosyltransferase family 4 protein [Dictyoglomus sp.]MDW8187997.1 glycosyltransferase family 4 protein [Dictyoglomus sp.]